MITGQEAEEVLPGMAAFLVYGLPAWLISTALGTVAINSIEKEIIS